MTKLTVLIKPIEHYFFGAENRRNDGTQNYFLYSLPFPQQTSILGAMRHLVLLTYHKENPTKELLDKKGSISKKELAKILIGDKGFRVNNKDGYGKIKTISELMILKEKMILLPDEPRKDSGSKPSDFEMIEGNSFLNENQVKFIPKLNGYDAKEPEKPGWVSSNGKHFGYSELFIEDIQPGNKKKNKGDDDDDAFYMQQYFHFAKNDMCFIIQMNVEEDSAKYLMGKHIIPFGGERTNSLIEVLLSEDTKIIVPEDEKKMKYYSNNPKFIKVVLTSDAYFRNNPYVNVLYSVSTSKPFRFLQSTVSNTIHHYNRGNSEAGLLDSNLFNLIERGSTFYFEDEKELTSWKLTSGIDSEDFKNIGYNQFVIIQPKIS